MIKSKARKLRDGARAARAGASAVAIETAAETLFHAGGKEVLSRASKAAVKRWGRSVAKQAYKELPHLAGTAAKEVGARAGGRALLSNASEGVVLAKTAVSVASKEAATLAGKEILKRAGSAAGVGAIIDGVFGACEGGYNWSQGTMSGKDAIKHTLKEAGTGAAANAAGVAAAATFVALTGGTGAIAIFGIAAGTSLVTKLGLTSLFSD